MMMRCELELGKYFHKTFFYVFFLYKIIKFEIHSSMQIYFLLSNHLPERKIVEQFFSDFNHFRWI